MSDNMVNLFTARGVTFLFPIQAKTFHHVYSGKDLIAQARTGTGKTFSFAIPLIEKLLAEQHDRKRGRAPQVTQTPPEAPNSHSKHLLGIVYNPTVLYRVLLKAFFGYLLYIYLQVNLDNSFIFLKYIY